MLQSHVGSHVLVVDAWHWAMANNVMIVLDGWMKGKTI
jgi:hypothetical protein